MPAPAPVTVKEKERKSSARFPSDGDDDEFFGLSFPVGKAAQGRSSSRSRGRGKREVELRTQTRQGGKDSKDTKGPLSRLLSEEAAIVPATPTPPSRHRTPKRHVHHQLAPVSAGPAPMAVEIDAFPDLNERRSKVS